MCLASEENAALLSDYPYPFKLVARYTLEDAAVRVSYEVTNEGTEDMPFFIGGHPGFRCPLDEARPIRTTSCVLRKTRLLSFALPSPRLA